MGKKDTDQEEEFPKIITEGSAKNRKQGPSKQKNQFKKFGKSANKHIGKKEQNIRDVLNQTVPHKAEDVQGLDRILTNIDAPKTLKAPTRKGRRRFGKPKTVRKNKVSLGITSLSKASKKIEETNKKRDIKSLNRLLSGVDYEENAKNAKLLIENLANEIFVSAEMRADFSQAAEQFLSDFLARKNEQNLPPIPKKKFKPREISIVAFLKDAWSEWLDRDLLTKQVLNAHDEKAYDALLNWERKNSLADEGLTIRSKSEDNDQFLERENFTKEEAFRVVGALKRRS